MRGQRAMGQRGQAPAKSIWIRNENRPRSPDGQATLGGEWRATHARGADEQLVPWTRGRDRDRRARNLTDASAEVLEPMVDDGFVEWSRQHTEVARPGRRPQRRTKVIAKSLHPRRTPGPVPTGESPSTLIVFFPGRSGWPITGSVFGTASGPFPPPK